MKNSRKLCALLLALLLLFSLASPAAANAGELSVTLDGAPLTFDVAPRLVGGRTMVPVRAVFEALGAEVTWDEPTVTVTAYTPDGNVITLVIGSTTLHLNEVAYEMDVAPFVTGARTLAPIRFIAEALGVTVEWDPDTWTVHLRSDGPRMLPLDDMFFPLADASNIQVHEFDFGMANIVDLINRPLPVPMAGVIAAPSTPGPHPLVVVIHGNALGQPEVQESIYARVYSGFGYLVRQLAAEGYVAISFNVSVDYSVDYGESVWGDFAYQIYQYHLARLEQANAGETVGHGLDLTGMIDFDEIHLIGHSRGGENADTFVRRERAAGLDRIRSIIRVGSTVFVYNEEDENAAPPDLPVGVILPEFDGDVRFLDGQIIFDEALAQGTNNSMISLVFLRGANHNWFNSFLAGDDGARFDFAVDRITRAEQEDFLMRYAAAFLSMTSQNRAPWGAFNVTQPQPVRMFGHDVVASTYVAGLQSVLATPVAGVPAATATGSATAAFYVQTWPWESEGLFSHPTVLARPDGRLPLYDLQWTGTDGAVSFPLLNGNFSQHQTLSLYLAMDSSSLLNAQGQGQALTITLRDGSGTERSVIAPPGTSALAWHPGHALYDDWDSSYYWEGHMPLGELRIPLTFFTGLDLAVITQLTISFDQTASGAVMLADVFLK
ncbi:MAG: stalk domain-containing protein [Oscillospiraceae bacterium]|nr:stalk domain-containing protein [Oscillospiraceae bacterium]